MLKKNSNTELLGQWIEIWYCEYDGSTIHFMICILSLIPILIFEALGWPWRVLGARHTGDCHIRHQAADYRRGRKHRRDQNHRQNRGNVSKPLPRPWSSSETMTEFRSHFLMFFFSSYIWSPQSHWSHLWLNFSGYDDIVFGDDAIFWAWAEPCA